MASAWLNAEGHDVVPYDFAAIHLLDRIYGTRPRSWLSLETDAIRDYDRPDRDRILMDTWRSIVANEGLMRSLGGAIEEAARGLAGTGPPDAVLFEIEDVDAVLPARRFARCLKALVPDAPRIALGRYFRERPYAARREAAYFDCVYGGRTSDHFRLLARWIVEPDRWGSVPGLTWRQGGRFVESRLVGPACREALPFPHYGVELQEELRRGVKVRLFDVGEEERGPFASKGPAVLAEIQRIRDEFGPCGFNVRGGGPGLAQRDPLMPDILSRRIAFWHGREATPTEVPASAMGAFRASGCRVLSLRVDSGSRRLLDDYFGHKFALSEAAAALGAAREANVYTVVRLTYPTLADDFHTRAETERFIEQTQPDAVAVRMAQVGPDGMGRRAHDRLLTEHTRFVLDLRARGYEVNVAPETALMARMGGYTGRESELYTIAAYRCLTGDAVGVAALAERINQGAASSPTGAALPRPFIPARHVVGN